ncbi:MAG: ribonuclease R [Oscillospiraceae bacterium]|nr:ribonuclease R [Oscillospiraceae bacterium]
MSKRKKSFKKHKGHKEHREHKDSFKAEVVRVTKTFGFIKKLDGGGDFFVSGRSLMGAVNGDLVAAKPVLTSSAERPEAEVIEILKENSAEITGTLERAGGVIYLNPDSISRELLVISDMDVSAHEGDKVLAKISKRGKRHADHKVRITAVFGDSELASSSAAAILRLNGIETEFSQAVTDEAKNACYKGIPEKEYKRRVDLREEAIFTIDGADTKDIDDAVSLKKTPKGWELGVHIADVSYYVKHNSELDKEAFRRGTSVYYADKVIPMLPKELSNGICSLNPNEDRLAFSCIMTIDESGKLTDYRFCKSIIKSRVKGVYDEVNAVIDCINNSKPVPLAEKYDGLLDMISDMDKLASILIENRKKRGAPEIDTPESKLTLDENGICVDVSAKIRGKGELIIEEFMIMANIAAAKTAGEKSVPFVYRAHEDPSAEKVTQLIDLVSRLNITVPHFSNVKARHLAEILRNSKDSPFFPAVSNMTLRAMAKAKYFEEPLGHFGLVLEDYSHFTSPIRRYPDLTIHRILTDLCYNKLPPEKLQNRYTAFAKEASAQSSARELAAMRTERECTDCYVAEYMKQHLGEEFEGVIVSVHESGFFVALPNTAEGFVRTDSLPDPPYDFDGYFTVTKAGKPVYKIGDKLRVICAAVNIASGRVDFSVV